VGAPAAAGGAAAGSGLAENVAGLLCYAFGWVTGIIFFATDKRPSVRFHAMQSIITFGALNALQWGGFGFIGAILSWRLAATLSWAIGMATLACWIILMLKAYQGERFKLPVVGDLAEQYSK
jgi:uncharacterized membrane protein